MGGCRHRSVAVGGSRKRSAAAKRRTARRVYILHGSATWLGCSPTTGRRAAIFSNGASKINHLWSKKGSSAPVLVCGGWFCRRCGGEAVTKWDLDGGDWPLLGRSGTSMEVTWANM